MNDVDFPVERVLDGHRRRAPPPASPVKVNAVVKRGVNEDEIVPTGAALPRHRAHRCASSSTWTSAHTNGWRLDDVVPAAEIVAMIGAELPLEPVEPNYRGEVAQRWRYRDGSGEIGVIASVTQPFCGDCTRARLSAEGKLYTCLFAAAGPRPRARSSRGGADDAELHATIGAVWTRRTDRYSELRTRETADLPQDRDVLHRRLDSPNRAGAD